MNKRIVALIAALGQVVACAHNPHSANVTETVMVPQVITAEQRTPSSELSDTPWTTWSEKGTLGGLQVLKKIRENLLANNLKDPHVSYLGYGSEDCI
ncbi:MAG: hypothetical protein EOP06_14285, partial [Proteobacteria bacterium]